MKCSEILEDNEDSNKPELKFTIIYDNNIHDTNLQEGFRFSCFVEFNDKKILFDTGGDSKAFFDNTQKLDIKLKDISHVVFSHQHWDHTAGFADVLQNVSEGTKLYLPHHFSSSLSNALPKNIELHQVENFQQIESDVYSLVLKGRTGVIKECFSVYEQAMIFDTYKGLVILTGCGHPGISNIINHVNDKFSREIHMVIGGLHLHHSFGFTINKVIKEMQSAGVKNIAPCHCTGKTATDRLQKAYGANFHRLGTGAILEI
jgi:7,8-dihydropterin-6-yl-methyl-4-(beta-D-ribofuranosyl)aminobenzene 5'-phosphate synthase